MKKFAVGALLLSLSIDPVAANAPPYNSTAPIAFMKDLSSGAILYDKGADQRIPRHQWQR